jgi:hypothetical protein
MINKAGLDTSQSGQVIGDRECTHTRMRRGSILIYAVFAVYPHRIHVYPCHSNMCEKKGHCSGVRVLANVWQPRYISRNQLYSGMQGKLVHIRRTGRGTFIERLWSGLGIRGRLNKPCLWGL